MRTIDVGHEGLAALRRAEAMQREDAATLGEAWANTAFVFTKSDGEPHHPDYLTRRFRLDAKRAGVRYIRLHGLRHTFATNALAQGRNPKAVSEILGHGHVQTTLALYSQHLPGMHASIIEAVQDDLFGHTSTPDVINPVISSTDAQQEQNTETEESLATARDSGPGGQAMNFRATGYEPEIARFADLGKRRKRLF